MINKKYFISCKTKGEKKAKVEDYSYYLQGEGTTHPINHCEQYASTTDQILYQTTSWIQHNGMANFLLNVIKYCCPTGLHHITTSAAILFKEALVWSIMVVLCENVN